MKTEVVELILPFKAEYVSIARLTSSGIANRIGFDIDVIEDIKVSISEVCNKLVMAGSTVADNYSVVFQISDRMLVIKFKCSDKSLKCLFDDNSGLGISIITALMDEVEVCADENYVLSMSKSIGEIN